MKTLAIFRYLIVIICFLTRLGQGSIYETFGRSLISGLKGNSGTTTAVLQRTNDNQWGRGDQYEQYNDNQREVYQRNQNSQRSSVNQGSLSTNRNSGRRDNNRGGTSDEYDRSPW